MAETHIYLTTTKGSDVGLTSSFSLPLSTRRASSSAVGFASSSSSFLCSLPGPSLSEASCFSFLGLSLGSLGQDCEPLAAVAVNLFFLNFFFGALFPFEFFELLGELRQLTLRCVVGGLASLQVAAHFIQAVCQSLRIPPHTLELVGVAVDGLLHGLKFRPGRPTTGRRWGLFSSPSILSIPFNHLVC